MGCEYGVQVCNQNVKLNFVLHSTENNTNDISIFITNLASKGSDWKFPNSRNLKPRFLRQYLAKPAIALHVWETAVFVS